MSIVNSRISAKLLTAYFKPDMSKALARPVNSKTWSVPIAYNIKLRNVCVDYPACLP